MEYISTKQAADAIGVAEATIRSYLASGKLKGERVGIGNRAVWMVKAISVKLFIEAGGRAKTGMKATKTPNPEVLG